MYQDFSSSNYMFSYNYQGCQPNQDPQQNRPQPFSQCQSQPNSHSQFSVQHSQYQQQPEPSISAPQYPSKPVIYLSGGRSAAASVQPPSQEFQSFSSHHSSYNNNTSNPSFLSQQVYGQDNNNNNMYNTNNNNNNLFSLAQQSQNTQQQVQDNYYYQYQQQQQPTHYPTEQAKQQYHVQEVNPVANEYSKDHLSLRKIEGSSLSTNPTFKTDEEDNDDEEELERKSRASLAPQITFEEFQHYVNEQNPSAQSARNGKEKVPPSLKAKEREEELIKTHRHTLDRVLPSLTIKLKQDWKKISKAFSKEHDIKATPAFLRNYYRSLSSNGCYHKEVASFSAKTDFEMVQLIQIYGLKWGKIAEKMGFNDPIRLKNRYYHHIKKRGLDKIYAEKIGQKALQLDDDFDSSDLEPFKYDSFSSSSSLGLDSSEDLRSSPSGEIGTFNEKLTKCEDMLYRFGEGCSMNEAFD